MRSDFDRERLWEGLADGIIQTIATDHCPFFFNGEQAIEYEGKSVKIPGKELGRDDFTKIPNGLPGVGDRLPILWTEMVASNRFTVNQFVALNCTNPARIFGMYPQKGTLLPGSDADIVLWDAKKDVTYGQHIAQHRTDYNLYEGWQLSGYPVKVFSRGELIVDNGKWLGKPGRGRFIHAGAENPIL
jgi:dihydropyrimidinase